MFLSGLVVIKKNACCTLSHLLTALWSPFCPSLHDTDKLQSLRIILLTLKKPLFKSDNFHVQADMEMAFLEQSWFALLGVTAHDSLLHSPFIWIIHNPHGNSPLFHEAVVHMTGRANFNEVSLLAYRSCSFLNCLSGRLVDAICNHCSQLTKESPLLLPASSTLGSLTYDRLLHE